MTFDPTKPVQTRDGRKARIICTDRQGFYPIITLVTDSVGNEVTNCVDANGKSPVNLTWDLVNIPERKSLFQNVYKTYDGFSVGGVFNSLMQTRQGRLMQTRQGQGFNGKIAVVELVFEDDKLVDTVIHPTTEA